MFGGGKMIREFKSLDGISTLELEFSKVDLLGTENIKETLSDIIDGNIFYAKKDISVYVSNARQRESIDSRQRFSLNGKVYLLTEEKYKVTEMDEEAYSKVIHYTDGQEALVKGGRFDQDYELEVKDWDLFKPIDTPKKFSTITKNVYFKTPWGERVFAPKGSKICIEYAETRDFFIVTNSLFKVAYQKMGDTYKSFD